MAFDFMQTLKSMFGDAENEIAATDEHSRQPVRSEHLTVDDSRYSSTNESVEKLPDGGTKASTRTHGTEICKITHPDGTYEVTITSRDGIVQSEKLLPDGSVIREETKSDGSRRFEETTPDGTVYINSKDKDGVITKEEHHPDGLHKWATTYPNGDHCSLQLDADGNITDYSSNPNRRIPGYEWEASDGTGNAGSKIGVNSIKIQSHEQGAFTSLSDMKYSQACAELGSAAKTASEHQSYAEQEIIPEAG